MKKSHFRFAIDSSVWIRAENDSTYAASLAAAIQTHIRAGGTLVMPTIVGAEADPGPQPVGTFLAFDEEEMQEAARIRKAVLAAKKAKGTGPPAQCLRVDILILATCLANDVAVLYVRDPDYGDIVSSAGLSGRILIHDTQDGSLPPLPLRP